MSYNQDVDNQAGGFEPDVIKHRDGAPEGCSWVTEKPAPALTLTEALAIIEKQQGFLSEIKHISGCLFYGDGTVGSMSPELVRLINSISKQALALTDGRG